MVAMSGTGTSGERRRPTMRDVAARAQVSLKTVSRVVNGEPGVSASLIARVSAAIAELDFRPDIGASSLRRTGGRTQLVGVLLEDVANPYSSAVQRAIEDVARPRGVMVISASLDEDPERERELTRTFGARRADGLILAPAGGDQSYLAAEVAAGTSIVCVDREPQGIDLDAVVTTNQTGAQAGTEHLIAHGHTRIAFLSDRVGISTAALRFGGYQRALSEHGLALEPSLVRHELRTMDLAEAAVRDLLALPDPPSAIFAAQNLVTIGAIRALRAQGLERQVALVGFDDFLLADLLEPGVTVIAQDPTRIGRVAAQVLFGRLAGAIEPTSTRQVPTNLIVRGSGEIRPPR